jgi:hypothetical protein
MKGMEMFPIFVRAPVRRYTCVLTSMSQRVDPSKFHERRKTDVGPFRLARPLVKINGEPKAHKKI